MKKLSEKVPEYTEELGKSYEKNTQNLLSMGVKAWMKSRNKAKHKMTEFDQEEEVKRIETELEEADGKRS